MDGVLVALELAHLPYRKKRSCEEYLGEEGRDRRGHERWEKSVHDVVGRFRAAFLVDYVLLGGGNARHLESLPPHGRRGEDDDAFLGGFRTWEAGDAR